MKLSELDALLTPKAAPVKEEEDRKIPASIPITDTRRLLDPPLALGPRIALGPSGQTLRDMSICFPHTPLSLRERLTNDMIAQIDRRVETSRNNQTVQVYNPMIKVMERRILRPDGHLGGVEL